MPITEDILNHQQSIQLENTAIKREIFDDDDALNGAVHTNGVSEVGTPLPNEALGSNEEIKKCPIQFEDVFAAGDSEEEDAKMNSMLSARKPSAYELEQIVKQKREADEKQRQEEEEFSMGDFSRESRNLINFFHKCLKD